MLFLRFEIKTTSTLSSPFKRSDSNSDMKVGTAICVPSRDDGFFICCFYTKWQGQTGSTHKVASTVLGCDHNAVRNDPNLFFCVHVTHIRFFTV